MSDFQKRRTGFLIPQLLVGRNRGLLPNRIGVLATILLFIFFYLNRSIMKILCLCPTYGRPLHLLQNTLACFQAQTHANRHLLICDDLGNLEHTIVEDEKVTIVSRKDRFNSLPEKYNWMWRNHPADAYCVWEDDDLYLPRHLEAHNRILEDFPFSYPSYIFSTRRHNLQVVPTNGFYHASLAFRSESLETVGGWIETRRSDFDLQFINKVKAEFTWGDCSNFGQNPTYTYRWEETNAIHGQDFQTSGHDTEWYNRYKPQNTAPVPLIEPVFDAPSRSVLEKLIQLSKNE